MAHGGSTETAGSSEGAGSLPASVGRYFFYGWLFRDASSGSELERAAALRHNRSLARWLPTYLRRWFVIGSIFLALGAWIERAFDKPVLAAAFAVAFVLVVVFFLVTLLCWTLLSAGR